MREPSGHLVCLHTGTDAKAAALLEGLSTGDALRITKTTNSGQTADRGMTSLRRPTRAAA